MCCCTNCAAVWLSVIVTVSQWQQHIAFNNIVVLHNQRNNISLTGIFADRGEVMKLNNFLLLGSNRLLK